jgi:hypothetical protein
MGPFVGQSRLCSNQDDLAVEAGVTQSGCDRIPGGTAADDYDSRRVSSRSRLRDQLR